MDKYQDYNTTLPESLDLMIQDRTGFTEDAVKNKELYERTTENIEYHFSDPLNYRFMHLTNLEQQIMMDWEAKDDYAEIEDDFSVDYGPDFD